MDIKSLYQEILNEHNLHPNHKGITENATITLQGVNPSCGDNIYLQLKIDDNGIITDGSFNGSGCAISQASVDMMLDDIIGQPKEKAQNLAKLFMDMIQGKETDDSKLEQLDEAATLKNISMMPARVKCAVLGWRTMQDMLSKNKNEAAASLNHCENPNADFCKN